MSKHDHDIFRRSGTQIPRRVWKIQQRQEGKSNTSWRALHKSNKPDMHIWHVVASHVILSHDIITCEETCVIFVRRKTPWTLAFCKLSILQAYRRRPFILYSCLFRQVAINKLVCLSQTCWNYLHSVSLWITPFDYQFAKGLLTSCHRFVVSKLFQAMPMMKSASKKQQTSATQLSLLLNLRRKLWVFSNKILQRFLQCLFFRSEFLHTC